MGGVWTIISAQQMAIIVNIAYGCWQTQTQHLGAAWWSSATQTIVVSYKTDT